jgi:hypothetical protein
MCAASDVDACGGRVVAREVDEGRADVEAADAEISGPRELDGEVAGTGGDFEHGGLRREAGGQFARLRGKVAEILAGVGRVPPGHPAFHPDTFICFRSGRHLAFTSKSKIL